MSKKEALKIHYPLNMARKAFYGEWRPWTLVDDTRWVDSERSFGNFILVFKIWYSSVLMIKTF